MYYPASLREVLRIVRIMETEGRKVFAGIWGKREHYYLMGLEFQSYTKSYGEVGEIAPSAK